MKNILTFEQFKIYEDGGVAAANVGNTGGMGPVVAPVISDSGNGCVATTPTGHGSGDLPAYDMGTHFGTLKKSKMKKGIKTKRKKSGDIIGLTLDKK